MAFVPICHTVLIRAGETGAALMPALRAIRPQTETREALVAGVRACREAGASALSFYNYGFMRLETLGRIREALQTA